MGADTLHRIAIWTDGPTIGVDDVREALLPAVSAHDTVLGRPLGQGFDIRELLREVEQPSLERAMTEAGGKKTVAAEAAAPKKVAPKKASPAKTAAPKKAAAKKAAPKKDDKK